MIRRKDDSDDLTNIHINAGQTCKIDCPVFGYPVHGSLMEYSHKNAKGYYHMINFLSKKKLILFSDDQFQLLPYKTWLLDLIDIALDMNDKSWFKELCYQIEYESDDLEPIRIT